MVESILSADAAILLWIQDNLRADWLTPIMTTITRLGGLGLIWILISLVLLCIPKTRWAGIAGLAGLTCSLLLNNMILKNLAARTRPYEVIEGLQLIGKRATDFSFPSGHTGSSFAAAVAICRTQKGSRGYRLLLVFAALMGFTRLYIGIHYPTDVICGALTGTVCGLFAAWLVSRCRASIMSGKSI